MKKLLSILFPLLALAVTSCKSDSVKMIEYCDNYLVTLDSVLPPQDLSHFVQSHNQVLRDLSHAAKGDSIYADQDMEKAKPKIFETMMKHSQLLEDNIKLSNEQFFVKTQVLILIYTIRLQYCTTEAQLQEIASNIQTIGMEMRYQNLVGPLAGLLLETEHD